MSVVAVCLVGSPPPGTIELVLLRLHAAVAANVRGLSTIQVSIKIQPRHNRNRHKASRHKAFPSRPSHQFYLLSSHLRS